MIGWKTMLCVALVAVGVGAGPAHAAWLPATELAPGSAPTVAVARDGTAFIAFERISGGNQRVAVAMRTPGSTAFGPARDLSVAGHDAFAPTVAVDRQGNATVAWLQGPNFVVHARTRPAGGDWGEITPPLSGKIAFGPSLAVGDNGAAVVAWGTLDRVEAAVRAANTGAFGGSTPVSPAGGFGICQAPRVAMDAAGNVGAIWTRRMSQQGDYRVETNFRAAGAPVFGTADLRSKTAGDAGCNTDIAMTPDGRTTAMWDFAETNQPSFVAIEDHGSVGWTGAVKVSKALARSIRPMLALSESGDAAAVWLSEGQVIGSARAFNTLTPLSGATETSGLAASASPGGDALAVFVGSSNGSDALFASRRVPGGAFAPVEPVQLTGPGVVLATPDVALDDQGNGFAVWRRSGGEAFSVQVAAFDPVAPVLTAADVPGAGTACVAVGMSAAATDRTTAPSLSFAFGDGSTAAGASVAHAYGAPGTYTVTVTATDAAGNRSSTTRPIAIAIAPAPVTQGQSNDGGGPTRPKIASAIATGTWDRLNNGRTRWLTLKVDGLEGPEIVKLACTGKGCKKKVKATVRKHKRQFSLTKHVKGVVLRPGAKLTVTSSRPGYITRIITFTMVARKNPKIVQRCQAPGSKKLKRC
jgi:hypothetical protein